MISLLDTTLLGFAAFALVYCTLALLIRRSHTPVQTRRIRDLRAWRLNVGTRWSRDDYEG